LQIILTRRDPEFVKRLFEIEVPEVFDGTIEIVKIVREAGIPN
jgi:N utilization substance protein A